MAVEVNRDDAARSRRPSRLDCGGIEAPGDLAESMSTMTGSAPTYLTALAAATYVRDGTDYFVTWPGAEPEEG